MNNIRRDFNDNIKHIEEYVTLLKSIEKKEIIIADNIYKLMKASTFLQLYNIIESNIANILIYIHDYINSDNLQFCELTDNLQKLWFKHLSSLVKKEDLDGTYNIIITNFKSVNFGNYTHQKYEGHKLSGNIDKKTITELCQNLGITINSSKISSILKKIKDERNLLAHGNITFLASGRNITPNDISRYIKEITDTYNSIFDSVELFCINNEYKR